MTGYLGDGSHILMAGVTGVRTVYGGKTAWASWWCDTWGRESFDRVLFYNPKGDDGPERFADRTVSTPAAAGLAFADGAEWVTLTPETDDWSSVHAGILKLARWLHDEDKTAELAVVHDEAPEYDDRALRTFVRVAGNGSNCKSVLLAQSPGDLSKKVRRQCILGWIGPATGEERGIFEANNRGAHHPEVVDQEPYHWSIMVGPEKGDRDTFEPVPEKYTD